jgi:hypothetical protein
MAQTGAGIQELMAAETRASQIVAEARMGMWSITDIAYFFCHACECTNFCFNTFSSSSYHRLQAVETA